MGFPHWLAVIYPPEGGGKGIARTQKSRTGHMGRGVGSRSGRAMSTNVRLTILLPLTERVGRGTKEHHYFLTNKRNSKMRLRFGRAAFSPAAAADSFPAG